MSIEQITEQIREEKGTISKPSNVYKKGKLRKRKSN